MKESERKEVQLVCLCGKTQLKQQEVVLTSDPGGGADIWPWRWCGIRQLLPTPVYYRRNICISENLFLGVLIKLNWVVGRVRAHTHWLSFSFYILNNYVLWRVLLHHKERILTSFPTLFSDVQKRPLKTLNHLTFDLKSSPDGLIY